MHSTHFKKLQRMYLSANINREIFNTTTISISEKSAEIGLTISPKYFHAMGAMHGAVYFKLLDDAAYFAANSIITDALLLTTSFNINLIRPANAGILSAIGKVKFASRDLFVAESILYNEQSKEIAFGTGNFAKSKVALTEEIGYQ